MTETLFIQFAALLAAAMFTPAVVFLANWMSHKSMKFWRVGALSYTALLFGLSFAALRNVLPELAAILISNGLIAVGYYLCLRSLRIMNDEWRFARLDAKLTLAFVLSFLAIIITNNTYESRVATNGCFLAAMSLMVAYLALRSKAKLSVTGDTAIALFGVGNFAFASARTLSAVTDSSQLYLSLDFWDPVFFIWSTAAVFCFGIGFLINGTVLISKETHDALVTQQKLGEDLTEALENQRNLQKLMLHEIKRPLNAISSAVQVIQAERTTSKESLNSLRHLVRHANTYLEGISDFEEINSLLDSPDLVPIQVSEFISDLRSKWGVKVSMDDGLSDRMFMGNALLLDIAISNLIENAQKYGLGKQPVEVQLSIVQGQLVFDVVDDGVGIPQREARNVFRKFYKIGKASGNALRGCGLGLYVVRRIAESHCGSAKVISAQPSIVRFTLPVMAA